MYPGDTIHIFDAGRDRFVKIEYKDALKRNLAAYAGGNPESGKQLDLSGLYQKVLDLADGDQTTTTKAQIKALLDGSSDQDTINGATFTTGDKLTKDELLAAFPTLLLLRPFQTWRMAR